MCWCFVLVLTSRHIPKNGVVRVCCECALSMLFAHNHPGLCVQTAGCTDGLYLSFGVGGTRLSR